MNEPTRFKNSWHMSVLESYLGEHAQYFHYDGAKAVCKVNSYPSAQDDSSFALEMYHSQDEGTVSLFLQPHDGDGDDIETYLQYIEVKVVDPESHQKVHKVIKEAFSSFDILDRLPEEEKKDASS